MKSNTLNYCIGFVTKKGLMLDLDNITERGAKRLCEFILKRHKMEGYLLIQSGGYKKFKTRTTGKMKKVKVANYHVVFNKYTSWRKSLTIVFSITKCVEWGIWQARKGEFTVRISKKNNKNKPKIILKKGQTDKLINDYLQIYKQFEEY